jgi:hypothetical protein
MMNFTNAFCRRSATVALAGALFAGTMATPPMAGADPDGLGSTLACAVPSTVFADWAKKAAKFRGGAILAALGTATVGWGCTQAIKNIDDGGTSVFDIQTPSGTTISQPMTRTSFGTTLPTNRPTISRMLACQGWTVQSLYNACLDGDLDPIYN